MSIVLTIPDHIVCSLKIPPARAKEELQKELAVHLYKHGYLSLGKARQLAGLSKPEFHILLYQKQISRHYDVSEYEEDLHTLSQ